MTDKNPTGEPHIHLASMKDIFTRLGFECGIDSIRFKPQAKNREKRGKKRVVGEKQLSVTEINKWQISQNELSELVLTIDLEQFQGNLRHSVNRLFGTKAEAEIQLNVDGIFDVAVLCVQPSTRTQERGYLNLPMEEELPIGCFGFKLKILTSNEGLTILLNNVFGLAYLPTDFLMRAEEWIHASLGIEGLSTSSVKRTNFSEISVSIDSLVLSAVGAKDSERRQAMDLLSKWREKNISRADYRLDFDYEDETIEISTVLPGERRPIQNISVQALEIRELIRENHQIEKAFIDGQWNLVSDLLSSSYKDDRNSYFQLRSALMILMASFPTKYKKAVEIVKSSTDSIEVLSAKLRVSDNRTESLSLLSKITRYVVEHFEFADHSQAIGLVFSEYLGDLWSGEDLNVAIECYDRALEIESESGRLLRKKKNLYSQAKNLKKCIETIDKLLEIEPRKIELSKLLLEKGNCFLEMGCKEEAVETGILAVSYDRASVKAALFLAGALKESEKFAECVQSLDDFLSQDCGSLSGKQQAEINTYIGEVWLVNLKSPEIAVSRLRQATILDADSELAYRLLATSLEQIGRIEEQLKVLEDYLLLAEKIDDSDAINWARSKLNLLYAKGLNRSSIHKLANLRSWLVRGKLSLAEFEQVTESYSSYDEWTLITASLNQRLSEIESNIERGMVCEKLAEGSKKILKNESLEEHFYRKAWEFGYLTENIFRANFQMLAFNDDRIGQAKLSEAWIEQDTHLKVLVIRDIIDLEIPVNALKLDGWILKSLSLDADNIDMLIRRLQHYIKIDNIVSVVKLWSHLDDSTLGLIRRRRPFNYIRDYLAEKNMFDILMSAYLFFIEKCDDQIETVREAIEILKGKISNIELGLLVKQSLACNEIPNLDEKLIPGLLESYPLDLRKYYLLRADSSSLGHERLSFIILALNISIPSGVETTAESHLNDLMISLFEPLEQSEWYGLDSLKLNAYLPKTVDTLTRYLIWWIPKISKKEQSGALRLLLDIMKFSNQHTEELLQRIDEFLGMTDEASVIERVAELLMDTDPDNRAYRLKLVIETERMNKKLLLEACYELRPKEFGEAIASIFQRMTSVGYNHIECFNFFIEVNGYSNGVGLEFLDRGVKDYLLSTLNVSDQVFKYWIANENRFPVCGRVFSYLFTLGGEEKIQSAVVLENVWRALFEISDNEVLSKEGMIWLLHQLKNIADNEIVRKIFLSMNPNLIIGSAERVEAFLVSRKIGDQERADFYSQKSELGGDSISELDRYDPPISELKLDAGGPTQAKNLLSFRNQDGAEHLEQDATISAVNQTEVYDIPQKDSRIQPNDLITTQKYKVFSQPDELTDDSLLPETLITEVRQQTIPTYELGVKTASFNWRSAISENSVNPADLAKLVNDAELLGMERHIALQAFYLTTGGSEALKALKPYDWRDRNQMAYKLHLGDRFPDHCVSEALLSPLASFLKEIYPIVVLNNTGKIALNGLANSLGKTEDQIVSSLKSIEWTDDYFMRAGIHHLDSRFKGLGYKVMDCYGIKSQIWIDAQRRWVILDFEYYKSQPLSCLFFAFLSKHWEIKLRFQTFLDSHPTFEILPLVRCIHHFFLQANGFSGADNSKSSAHDNHVSLIPHEILKSQTKHVDQDKIRFIVNELKLIEEGDILRTLFSMKAQVHRLCLAESLDLIGLVESITKRNLSENPTKSLHELISLSKYMQPLFKFVLQMHLTGS